MSKIRKIGGTCDRASLRERDPRQRGAARVERTRRPTRSRLLLVPTGFVGELKEEKRGSVASRCRRAALTCLVRNSLVQFVQAKEPTPRERSQTATKPLNLPYHPDFSHLHWLFHPSFPPPSFFTSVIFVLPSASSRLPPTLFAYNTSHTHVDICELALFFLDRFASSARKKRNVRL